VIRAMLGHENRPLKAGLLHHLLGIARLSEQDV
jgi:hypothetical protein